MLAFFVLFRHYLTEARGCGNLKRYNFIHYYQLSEPQKRDCVVVPPRKDERF